MGAPSWFMKIGNPAGGKSGEPGATGKTASLPAVMPKAAPGKGIPLADRIPERPAPAPMARPPETAPAAATVTDATSPPSPEPVAVPRHGLNGAPADAERARAPRSQLAFPNSPAPAAPPPPPPSREMGCPARAAQDDRSAQLTADQANQLLLLAERSQAIVERALRRVAEPGAGAGDLAAGKAVEGCVNALAEAMGSVNTVVKLLRMTVRTGTPARITAPQVAALETFVKCALDATEASQAAGNA